MKLLILLVVYLLASCNALQMMSGGETKIDDSFYEGQSICSSCSNQQTLNCPLNYAFVSANTLLGTEQFCVAQYEMKNVATVATSQSNLLPWVSINPTTAKAECQNLGVDYDLISNSEWMTISYEIENNSSNWSSGSIGSGMINRGHSDNTPAVSLAITSTADYYSGTGNNSGQGVGSGWEQKRVHFLANSQTIWDFAGNVAEWVDWNSGGAYEVGATSCTAAWAELNALTCGALTSLDYLPINSSYTSSEGFGQFFGGTGGATRRGGFFNETIRTGIYSLNFQAPTSTSALTVGFRCVYKK